MKIKFHLILLFSCILLSSCRKEDVDDMMVCKNLARYYTMESITNVGGKPVGFRSIDGKTYNIGYQDGKLSYLQYNSGREDFFYENSKIVKAILYGDTILFDTDNLGRIIRLNYLHHPELPISEIAYDSRGNISTVEISNEKGEMVHKAVFFDFDGNKSPIDKSWGWPVDVSEYYRYYPFFRNFYLNPDGNPKRETRMDASGNKLEIFYSYKYSDLGYLISEFAGSKIGDRDSTIKFQTYAYSDCE